MKEIRSSSVRYFVKAAARIVDHMFLLPAEIKVQTFLSVDLETSAKGVLNPKRSMIKRH
jgi:hypothetical protein